MALAVNTRFAPDTQFYGLTLFGSLMDAAFAFAPFLKELLSFTHLNRLGLHLHLSA